MKEKTSMEFLSLVLGAIPDDHPDYERIRAAWVARYAEVYGEHRVQNGYIVPDENGTIRMDFDLLIHGVPAKERLKAFLNSD